MPNPNHGIKVYKNGDYKTVNHYLRKIRGVRREYLPNGALLEQWKIDMIEKIIQNIDERMVPDVRAQFAVLYRGTSPEEFGLKSIGRITGLIGKRLRWKSYTSTSDQLRCAEKYSSGGVILEIETSPAVSYIDLRSYIELKHTRTEPEILLARNTQYRITGVDSIPGKRYIYVKVQLIGTYPDT